MKTIHKLTKYIKGHKEDVFLISSILVVISGIFFYLFSYLPGHPKAAKIVKTKESNQYYFEGSSKVYGVKIGERETNEPKVEFSLTKDKSITFSPASARTNLEKPQESKGKITFKNVYQDTDYTYQTIPLGIKEDIVIYKPNGISIYPFYLDTKGVTPKYFASNLAGGVFYDKDGKYIFHFEKPYAIDAKGERTDNANITIKKDEAKNKLVALLVIDKDWLNSPQRAYPITIDPTVVHDTTAEFAAGQLNRVVDTGSGNAPSFSATGGTISTVGEYTVHTFTSDGTFTPNGTGNVEVIVVGGGGGGSKGQSGVTYGGAGGGGGIQSNNSYAVTAQAYSITVGGGGSAATGGSQNGGSGNPSIFDTLTAGGGVGGGYNGNGGASGTPQSNAGVNKSGITGGGGGGSGGAGSTTTGGAGTTSSISGSSVAYGGGGGGSNDSVNGVGTDGGGNGGALNNAPTNGTTNRGGGGGSTRQENPNNAGAGGSGIVIIRYKTLNTNLTTNYQELPTDVNTIGLYHFGNGACATDGSGNAYTLTANGGMTCATGGMFGYKASGFATTPVSYSHTTILDRALPAGTIEAWINPANLTAVQTIIYADSTSDTLLTLGTSGQINFSTSASTNLATANNVVVVNTWTHVAATWTTAGHKIFINGVETASDANTTTHTSQDYTTYVGVGAGGNTLPFSGSIDEVRISNIARTPEEIKLDAQRRPYSVYTSDVIDLTAVSSWNSLYWSELGVTTGDGETLSSSTNLVAQWNFNETSGTTADNAETTADRDFTLNNFASTASQDQAAGTGWTAANKRWGAGGIMLSSVATADTLSISNPGSNGLDPNSSDLSIEMWVKTNDVTAELLSNNSANGVACTSNGYYLGIDASGYPIFYLDTNGATAGCDVQISAPTTKINDGKWHLLTVTVTRGTSTVMYLDGINIGSDTSVTSYSSVTVAGNVLVGSTNAFDGIIDSTRVYSRALSQNEILSNYQAGNVELQTRVGASTDANDGTWEAWKPTTGETAIDALDNNETDSHVYQWSPANIAIDQVWYKKDNSVPSNSDTTSTNGRIPLGTSGKGDDAQIGQSAVLVDGATYKMWYMGNDGTNNMVYYATSTDGGYIWTKLNNTTATTCNSGSACEGNGKVGLGTGGNGDTTNITPRTVIKDGSTYKMWYGGNDGTNWRIYYATSSDGLTWTKYNNVLPANCDSGSACNIGRLGLGSDTKGDDVHVTHPSVIKDGSTYKMWYTGNDGTYSRIFYATSSDGITWTKYNNVSPATCDSGTVCASSGGIPLGSAGKADSDQTTNPWVIKDGPIYKMWYTGYASSTGRFQTLFATSHDGITWMKINNTIPTSSNTTGTNGRVPIGTSGGDTYRANMPVVIKVGDGYKMWYEGFENVNARLYMADTAPFPYSQSTDTVIKSEGTGSEKFILGRPGIDAATVGLWHLDETGGTGAYLKDSTANANHATPTGTSVINGFSGKARSFNGSSDFISASDTSLPAGASARTMSIWFKSTSTALQMLMAYGNYTNTNVAAIYLNSGKLNFGTYNSCDMAASTATVTDGTWHLATVTYNGTIFTMYLDGVYLSQLTCTPNTTVGPGIFLGKWGGSPTYYFTGSLDEASISNTARSAEEIAEAYRAGRDHYLNKTISSTDLSAKTSLPFYVASDRQGTFLNATIGESAFANYQTDANTVGLWHLDEQSGSGAYIKDSSGTNHGTPTGTTFTQGKIGKARSFNGSSDVVTITGNQGVTNGDITIEAWFNATNATLATDHPAIVSHYDDTAKVDYRIFQYTTGIGVARHAPNVAWNSTAETVVTARQWYHVALTYTGTTLSFYLNGVLQRTVTASSTGTGTYTTQTLIGKGNASAATYFAGFIDEVRISNAARTADQIRQAYEVGARTHNITIDFKAALNSGNFITNTSDLGFTIDATAFGASSMGSNLFKGDKIIVKENYDGTEYIAQGTVNSLNTSTGAVTVTAWDSGSTVPSGGFTVNATVFKWQREYFDLRGSLSTHRDAVTNLTLRETDGSQGANVWLDDFRSSGGYLTTPAGSTITSSVGNRYFQYRVIPISYDPAVSASFTSVTLDYVSNSAPATPSLDLPTDTATNQSLLPIIKTTTTDADADYLRYKIHLCTDSGMTANCQTFDQTASQTGWSGQNTQSNTAYTSGTQGIYTVQTALTAGTTYYWKSYAIDPGGSNSWSSTQATPYSFTTNAKPSTPSLDLPLDTATGQILAPVLKTTTTDTDTDYLRYKIQVCTDSGMTANCQTFDQTSSQTGWSGQNTEGSTAYTSGTQGIYTLQAALNPETTYYWRSYAKDPGGSNTWSSTQATPYSFTTTSPPTMPSGMFTEGVTNPVSVTDTTPEFSAICNDSNIGDTLNKYQIQVDTETTFSSPVWDSGSSGTSMTNCTQGNRSSDISFGGSALSLDGTTYYWRIKFWDTGGAEGSWSSETAYFRMDLAFDGRPSSCRIKETTTNDSSLTLLWTDNSSSETQFRIEKNINGAGFNLLTNPATDSVSYQDNSISQGNTYQYRIRAEGGTNSEWCTTTTVSLQAGTFQFKGIDLKGLIIR